MGLLADTRFFFDEIQDRLIISTAIPQITDDFHSVTDIGWYGSAYLLTNCSFQLSFGKLYSFFSVKGVFLVSIGLFEIGSAICGAAPNSVAFIVGRAIAGLGSAGIFSGGVSLFPLPTACARLEMVVGLTGVLDHCHRLCCAAAQATSLPGHVRGGVWACFCHWASAWWRFHEQGQLEMVL